MKKRVTQREAATLIAKKIIHDCAHVVTPVITQATLKAALDKLKAGPMYNHPHVGVLENLSRLVAEYGEARVNNAAVMVKHFPCTLEYMLMYEAYYRMAYAWYRKHEAANTPLPYPEDR